MGMCTQVHCPWTSEGGNRFSRAGVIVGCEMPYVDPGNWPVVFH